MYSLRLILEVGGQEGHNVHSLRPILEVGGHNVQSEGHTGGKWTGESYCA